MDAIGQIVEIKGSVAVVKFARTKACKSCGACVSFSNDEMIVELANTLNAQIGDRVRICLSAKSVLTASLIMYGIPLAAMLAGAALGSLWGDLFTAVCGIGGALLAFALLRILEPRFARGCEFQPTMSEIVQGCE